MADKVPGKAWVVVFCRHRSEPLFGHLVCVERLDRGLDSND